MIQEKELKKSPVSFGGEGLEAKARGGGKKETNVKPFGVKESKEKKQKKGKLLAFSFSFCSRDRGRFVPPGEEEGKSKVPFLLPPFLFTLKALFPFFS